MATVDGHTVHVSGTTSLPDGARMSCYYGPTDVDIDGDCGIVTAQAGTFAFDEALAPGAGSITFYLDFEVSPESPQPQTVIDLYGPNGEHLAGDGDSDDYDDVPEVFSSVTVVVPAGS